MTIFCMGIKPDSEGFYEIHTLDCHLLPNLFTEIGMFDNPKDALKHAHSIKSTTQVCQICTPEKKKKFWNI